MLTRLKAGLTPQSYFSWLLLLFLAAFVVLPSSKAVNNFYYVLLALPGLCMVIAWKFPKTKITYYSCILLALFGYLFLSNLLIDGGSHLKELLYVFVFCLIIFFWVNPGLFLHNNFRRFFFWSLVIYVCGSILFYWLTGDYSLGQRVVVLPNRLSGPILTSMLIVCSLILLVPVLINNRSWFELALALLLSLIIIGYILQSRSGLVGLLVAGLYVFSFIGLRSGWVVRLAFLIGAFLAMFIAFWAVNSLEAVGSLLSRADSGRFELWLQYLTHLQSCGWLAGCGFDYDQTIYIRGHVEIQHPHNIFLAFAFHGGLAALVLFVLAVCSALFLSWRQRNPWGGYLVLALVMLMFDGGAPINSPNELWLLIWLPLMLIAAKEKPAYER